MIEKATLQDLERIEKIMHKSFIKFELNKFFQEYDKDTIISNLKIYFNNDMYGVYKHLNREGNIDGVLIVLIYPQIFNNKNMQIHDITIQPNPDLGILQQSKILIKLINFMIDLGREKRTKTICITINPKFDISGFLSNKGFVNSDNIYIKEVI